MNSNLTPEERYLNNLLIGHRELIEMRNQRLEILLKTPSNDVFRETACYNQRKQAVLKWMGIVEQSKKKVNNLLNEINYPLAPYLEMLNAKNQQ